MGLPTNKNILSVSQVNEYVKMLIDSNPVLQNVYIKGEISNFVSQYRTGHMYFSLKDEDGVISAVIFKFDTRNLAFTPENGMKVIVSGRVSVYPQGGRYQVYVKEMFTDGVGALYIAYEQMRKRLEAEGLFREEHKKPLPKYPKTVGIITSATGAAIHDMCSVAYRRYPSVTLVLYSTLVQGAEAPRTLIEGVRYFNNRKNVDVIIIGRGGGSIEDLWAFNDESLAREIYNSQLPIISAVGHESDFTICDFVCDLRAPTPSAAMELCLPNSSEIIQRLKQNLLRVEKLVNATVENRRELLRSYAARPCFEYPEAMTVNHRMRLDLLSNKLDTAIDKSIVNNNSKLKGYVGKLDGLSPLAVISRGYGLVTDSGGEVVTSVGSLTVEEKVNIALSDGKIEASVLKITRKRRNKNE